MPPEINPPIDIGINALFLNDHHLERTSDWSQQEMDSFNIAIDDSMWASRLDTSSRRSPSDIYPPAINLIVSKSSDTKKYKDVGASQKPFYNRLRLLKKRPSCPGVDIAHDLLTYTGFQDGPLHFLSQPKLETKISTMTIVSDASYVVIGQFLSLVYMVVIEDTRGSETFAKRRYQMAGDMVVAATIRHSAFSQHACCASSTRVFGMLVYRTYVSFYQATFTHEDVTESQSGCPTLVKSTCIEEHTKHDGYSTINGFSVSQQEERKSIVSILLGIKREILSMMSDF
jgi:hypothetical protein